MLTIFGKKSTNVLKGDGLYVLPGVTVPANSGPALIEAKAIDGETYYTGAAPRVNSIDGIGSALVANGGSASRGVAFGSGNSAESEQSYTLDNQITNLSITHVHTSTANVESSSYDVAYTYTVTNNSNSDIVIKEIGLFAVYCTVGAKGDSLEETAAKRYSFLIDRTLLDNPVTILAGESGVVRYLFKYSVA